MGTNYYWLRHGSNATDPKDDRLHVGKSSVGWVFALRIYPHRSINGLEDWLELFEFGTLTDEYDRPLSTDEMVHRITKRRFDGQHSNKTLRLNNAYTGPNGLMVGHREWLPNPTQPYSLHAREFS